MLSDLFNWVLSSFRILASPTARDKRKLIFTYFRLRSKLVLSRAFGIRWTQETLFGFTVGFFDYATFVYLFEEIFVQQSYFFSSTRRAPVILDCGSNIGLAVIYFKYLYPESRIDAFEPDAAIFAMLKRNVEINRLSDVHLHNFALLDREGSLEFFADPGTEGSLVSGISPRQGNSASLRVPCRPLSPFVQGVVDFMKMDIEGAEADCLREVSAARKLCDIRHMAIECHHNIPLAGILVKVLSTLEENEFSYQVSAPARVPLTGTVSQDVMVHAFAKESGNGHV